MTSYNFKSVTYQMLMTILCIPQTDKRVPTIVDSLSHEFTILCEWFYNNLMLLNPDKCSFMFLCVDDSLQTNLVCGEEICKNTKREKIVLGVTLNNKLNFATHLLSLKMPTKNLMH